MQSTQDYIEMRLPASAEYVSLIRLTLSGVFSRAGASYDDIAVSYTHLTLPTIYSV